MEIKVLYEDNHLIAVYKPAGVLVMAGDEKAHDDDTLYWQVKQFIKQRDNKPGDAFLGVLHRLDRPVSGIVLFAKTSKGASRLSEQIRERKVTKIYTALVGGIVEMDEGTLMDTIQKDRSSIKAIIGGGMDFDPGQDAVLHYQVIKRSKSHTLLKIQLETGRFHQIRAQLSNIGHPIVGDSKYGSKEKLADNSVALCATELYFTGATDGEQHRISIDYPKDWDGYLK